MGCQVQLHCQLNGHSNIHFPWYRHGQFRETCETWFSHKFWEPKEFNRPWDVTFSNAAIPIFNSPGIATASSGRLARRASLISCGSLRDSIAHGMSSSATPPFISRGVATANSCTARARHLLTSSSAVRESDCCCRLAGWLHGLAGRLAALRARATFLLIVAP